MVGPQAPSPSSSEASGASLSRWAMVMYSRVAALAFWRNGCDASENIASLSQSFDLKGDEKNQSGWGILNRSRAHGAASPKMMELDGYPPQSKGMGRYSNAESEWAPIRCPGISAHINKDNDGRSCENMKDGAISRLAITPPSPGKRKDIDISTRSILSTDGIITG